MRTAYFFDYQLPGQAGRWLVAESAAEHRAAQGQTQSWQDELTRYQAIYEELLASPDWAGQAAPLPPAPRQRGPSVRDLTRDLAGWSPPPGQRPAAKS